MPLVSVIVPTRDRAALLPRAVRSILGQTERDFEILVVDNNSGRPITVVHADDDWLRDPRVRVLWAAGACTAAASRNVGLATASGKFVTYLDDDDAYRPEKLARQIERLESSGRDVVLCGASYRLAQRERVVQTEAEDWSGDAVLLRARWGTPFLMHRATSLRFEEALAVAEDLEFGLRLWAAGGGGSVPVVSEPLVDVYPQPGARVNTNIASRHRAVARVLHAQRGRFSREARRRFLLQAMLATAKHSGRAGRCVWFSLKLLRESKGRDWRACVNACLVGADLMPQRWVS